MTPPRWRHRVSEGRPDLVPFPWSRALLAVVVAFLTALAGAVAFTPLCRRLAVRTGFLAYPSNRGVHREPTPLLGGVALFFGFVIAIAVGFHLFGTVFPARIVGFLGGGALIFVMGVIDDRADLGWFSKLLGQICASVLLLASGEATGEFFLSPLGLVLSLVWLVGMTNALNFLDNMDGVCAGIASVTSLALVGLALLVGEVVPAILAAALAGASLGFLRYNFAPARIFLGDGGSLFLGYVLACLGLMVTRSSELSLSLLVPVVALAYPIFDITFVSATRHARGQSLTHGGKDHTSHRLARVTGSPVATAWTIYGICTGLGLLAMALQHLSFAPATVVGFLAVAFSFLGFGIRLARLAPVPEASAAASPATS